MLSGAGSPTGRRRDHHVDRPPFATHKVGPLSNAVRGNIDVTPTIVPPPDVP